MLTSKKRRRQKRWNAFWRFWRRNAPTAKSGSLSSHSSSIPYHLVRQSKISFILLSLSRLVCLTIFLTTRWFVFEIISIFIDCQHSNRNAKMKSWQVCRGYLWKSIIISIGKYIYTLANTLHPFLRIFQDGRAIIELDDDGLPIVSKYLWLWNSRYLGKFIFARIKFTNFAVKNWLQTDSHMTIILKIPIMSF